MADALVDQQGQSGFGSACSACGIGENRLTTHEGNRCPKCDRVGCTSCYSQNIKPDLSSDVRPTDSKTCEPLDTITNGLGSSNEGRHTGKANTGDMSREESPQKLIHPGKSPHAAQVKPRSIRTNMHTSAFNSDRDVPNHTGHQNDLKGHNMSRSGIKTFTKSVPLIEQGRNRPNSRSSTRFKAKRNEQGLCSKSEVPTDKDNRNIYLTTSELYQGRTSTNTMTARENITRTTFKRSMVPQSPHQKKMQTLKMNKEHQIPTAKRGNEWNDQPSNKTNQPEQVHTAKRPEIHLQMSSLAAGRPERHSQNSTTHSEYRMTHMIQDKLPQNSQFHNKTIKYPSSTEAYPYTSQRQPMTTEINHQQYHSSYNAVDSRYSYKPIPHMDSSNNARQNFRLYVQSGVEDLRNNQLRVENTENFDDFDDVPALDEIPYALLITNSVDEKTLLRAKQKQMQQLALDLIKINSRKSKDGEKVNQEESQDPFVSESGEDPTGTCREHMLSDTPHHTLKAFQKSTDSEERHNAVNPFENEIPLKESFYRGHPDALNAVNKYGSVEDLRPVVEESLPRHTNKTNFGDDMKTNPKINCEYEKKSKVIGRPQSPVHVSDKTRRKASFVNKPDIDIVNKEEKKSLSGCAEQQQTDRENERCIRKKRLENLKAEEISSANRSPEMTESHKPYNREVTFRSDVDNKPVKSTTFRLKVHNLMADSALQQKTDKSLEVSAGENHPVDMPHPSIPKSNLGTSNTRNNTNACEKPLTMKLLQTTAEQTRMRIPQSNSKLEKLSADKQNDSGNIDEFKYTSSSDDTDDDRQKSDEETEPIAMKLLRRQHQQEQIKHSIYFRKSQSSVRADENDEDLVEPMAMRLLRLSKEEKKKAERRKTLQYGAGNTSDISVPLLNALSTIFGNTSGNVTPGAETSTRRRSDGGADAKQPKQMTENKNKNISPLKQKGQESCKRVPDGTEDIKEHLVNVSGVKKQHDDKKVADDNDSQIVPVSDSSGISNPLEMSKIADNRHRAFQKLKMSQSEDRLKCTSCGRPECQGHNIRKMKEMIQMAKHAGFEVRDVVPDGNCMFAAVVDQLELYGDYSFGPKSLRESAVSWLIEHPHSDDGTHYSSFLSEDWEVYLQRMIAEGEWGDHLILRAVVETIGHTVEVLSVSGEESRSTILKPASIDASKDGMRLVLGHLGEFHYISLRPADDRNTSFVPAPMSPAVQDPEPIYDDEQLALEGTETIDMFREDYIDAWSDMPSAHFSYLLKNVIPIKVVNTAAIEQSQRMDSLSNPDLFRLIDIATGAPIEIDVEFGGSVAEGVYVPKLYSTIGEGTNFSDNATVEVYGVLKKYVVVGQTSGDGLHEGRLKYVTDTSGVHIGFTKVLGDLGFSGEHGYLPQIKMNLPQIDINWKQNSVIRCQHWPECAKSWVSRVRREGWPSTDLISSIETDGCLLLPKAHKESKCPDFEWQFSFTNSERKLFRDAVSLYQKYCYILFDALCTQTMRHLESISSSHLKSVFFYACERIPAEVWESSPGACVFYMLDELLRYVRSRNLPNYFVHANNMIDHLKEKDFKEIEEQIILLRSQPVLFLRQINESLGMLPHGDTIIDKVSDDCPKFKEHKSLKKSTLEVFIPATIKTVHQYIRTRSFEVGYEVLSQAFQQRLSVSTCDDSVPFQVFLSSAVSGLDLDSLVWFSAYTDRQLEGQLSKSLVRETCGDLPLVRIKDILPADIVGSYGNTEVPTESLTRICSFCHDFAKFLFQTNKLSEILPVLYHCHEQFVKKLKDTKSLQRTNDKSDGQQTSEDFTDEAMFDIYTAMYTVYRKQQQVEFFRAVMPVVHAIVERINTRWAYSCLCFMYQELGDSVKLMMSANVYHHLPKDPMEPRRVAAFLHWPYRTNIHN